MRRARAILALLSVWAAPAAASPDQLGKLDDALRLRALTPAGISRIIIRTRDARPADALVQAVGGQPGPVLPSLGGQIAEVPDAALLALAAQPSVDRISIDRPVVATLEPTSGTIGASRTLEHLGYDGRGVGVAIVDSGVTSWHDDLTGAPEPGDRERPLGVANSQRVVHFVDFVNHLPAPYDDFGHGTHVAGIIAGNGYDSSGVRAGVAPGASLIVLKVLDGAGRGHTSDVIAAIDYAIRNRQRYNIRVLNLSVAAGVYESYTTDPLTLAARRAVDAGIVVVTAAGNLGRRAGGGAQYGAITAPGNAPWVITVGASSHMGTTDRADDVIAAFSSRGPTYLDYQAKPDLIAPGVGIESLSDPSSRLYLDHPEWRLPGNVPTWYLPYFALTGTSMAAPVVSGTVALLLQANPALTPNAVKAILQYTAEARAGDRPLAQGAGFLNARGAVHLARLLAGEPETEAGRDEEAGWSRRITWGSHRIGGGVPRSGASAWSLGVVWGNATAPDGGPVTWGILCAEPSCEDVNWGAEQGTTHAVWGAAITGDRIVWGGGADENIVWGAECGGADCRNVVWGAPCDAPGCDNLIWGAGQPGDAIVWGVSGTDDIVWQGSDAGENVVWGRFLATSSVGAPPRPEER